MNINAKTTMCCVIGNPIEHSLSPALHNAGYEKMGINFVYVAFRVEKIAEAVEAIKALGIRGVSVTIPHKVTVMKYLDAIDPLAQKIGAVNTIVNDDGRLTGFNTDYLGAIRALEEKTTLKDKKVVILGAGGAAKAIAYGLSEKGAKIHILNRTKEHAQELANVIGGSSGDLTDRDVLMRADVIINATSVGMSPNIEKSPIDSSIVTKKQIVMDIVYNPKETKLLREAREKGSEIVYGYKMLLYQAVSQFEMFTREKVPVSMMEQALLKGLEGR